MKISIVIPAYNEEKLLPQTLLYVKKAAEAFLNKNWEYEIIVCDNNSSDNTAEIARSYGAMVVFEQINQIARARNKAARAATGDWLIFIDADCKPSFDLFNNVSKAIETNKVVGGGCIIRLDDVPFLAQLVCEFWNWISRLMKWAAGSFIFCKSDVFTVLGGFNEELFVSEEIDFSKRLKTIAKFQNKKIIIITQTPLITSGRKVHLYNKREYFLFILKTLFSFGAATRQRESCNIWYDGRR
ncbi:MAG: glycosyltransferase [Verrucomicrobiia bacterium]